MSHEYRPADADAGQPMPEAQRANLFDLSGEVAVVTGAARGIGRAAAAALSHHGASVVLFDRLTDELGETRDALAANTATVESVVGDVTTQEDLRQLTETAGRVGPVSLVVNAAGFIRRMNIAELTLPDLDAMWEVNVRGTAAVTQTFLPQMIERRKGKIINVGSLGSVAGLEQRTAYATTKGAVAQYTVSLASEVGRYGICANVVAPGYVETEMTSDWIWDDPARTEKLLGRIPLGRFARPQDVAGTFIFLAAPASNYITGQVILVDGGWRTA